MFVDTSALLALLDSSDAKHSEARAAWERFLTEDRELITTNYVLLETTALAQRRFGLAAVRVVQDLYRPVLRLEWIDERRHERAMAAVFTSGRRKLSLVDCSSFIVMSELAIEEAFAFDKHFREQGFRLAC